MATKKTAGKKASGEKPAARKATTVKTAKRKYSPAAGDAVARELHLMHEGKLKSSSGQEVTNPKQAIAIGLSESRRAGKKVPPPPEK